MNNLDNVMDVLNSLDERDSKEDAPQQPTSPSPTRTLVGTVEAYFAKINVAAIKLEATIMTGDLIEIGSEEEAIRQRITSMQIDREDVSEAYEGQSIGIKVNHPVQEGAGVYKII